MTRLTTIPPHVTIVGLDISLTSTGIAILRGDQRPLTTHVGRTGRRGETFRERSERIATAANQILDYVPDSSIVVIEGPSYRSVSTSTWDRAGLWNMIMTQCFSRGCTVGVIPPVVNKKFLTGTPTATKTLMVLCASRVFGKSLETDDEADALALALMGAHHYGWFADPNRDSTTGCVWEEPTYDA